MVSLEHIANLDLEQAWIAIVITILCTIILISGLLYCLPFGFLFKGGSLTGALRSKKAHRKVKRKHMIIVHDNSSLSTYPVNIQHSPRTLKSKSKTVKFKTNMFLGKLQLHLKFNKSRSVLEVHVISGQNLATIDVTTSDLYCKLMLLPARHKKLATSIKPRTRSPVWNEIVPFVVMKRELPQQTLYVYVLDHDHFNKDAMVGECRVNLCNYDLQKDHMIWRDLKPFEGYARYLGEILISLCYSASQEKLTITIVKCTNLKAVDLHKMSNSYVKLFYWKNGKRYGKQKTTTKPSTQNPVFKESFVYEVSLTQIHSCEFLVEVMDSNEIKQDNRIGCALLGEKANDMVALHWKEMCNTMDTPVEQWHRLKTNING